MARTMGLRVLHGEADPSGHALMELWRGVHRSLGLGPSRDPSLPAGERRWNHVEALADALVACAPAVVVLEDLHWADQSVGCSELRRAVGLGGRDRPTGSDAERARINVVRSLRRAIAAIADRAPMLGAHLEGAVRTCRHCIYLPEPSGALSWRVDLADRTSS